MDRQKRRAERIYQLVGEPEQGALDVGYLWYSADLLEPASIVTQKRRIQDYAESRTKLQTEHLNEVAHARGYDVVAVITEQASSLSERCRGMKKLLALVGEKAVDIVLVAYPDRLVRFGFRYLDPAFHWQQVGLSLASRATVQPCLLEKRFLGR